MLHLTTTLDVSEITRAWPSVKRELVLGTHKAVRAACEEGAAEARASRQFKDRSGALRRSIRDALVALSTTDARGVIEAKEPYASFVEDGTRAHLIRPKARAGLIGPTLEGQGRRKRGTGNPRVFLRWVSGGRVFFARVVHHPGTKPRPYMGMAYLKAERVLFRVVEEAVPRAQAVLDR